MVRVMGSVEVPHTGLVVGANMQHVSGKPWGATTQISLPQGDQRRIALGSSTRLELLFDVLNALNDTAEEALATDNLFSVDFGRPTMFVDPRRAMLALRLTVGH